MDRNFLKKCRKKFVKSQHENFSIFVHDWGQTFWISIQTVAKMTMRPLKNQSRIIWDQNILQSLYHTAIGLEVMLKSMIKSIIFWSSCGPNVIDI